MVVKITTSTPPQIEALYNFSIVLVLCDIPVSRSKTKTWEGNGRQNYIIHKLKRYTFLLCSIQMDWSQCDILACVRVQVPIPKTKSCASMRIVHFSVQLIQGRPAAPLHPALRSFKGHCRTASRIRMRVPTTY